MSQTWTMLDTFSGIGGFSLAAEWTGRITPVQFIEIDPWCRRVLAKHWPGVPIHDDIKTFLADPMRAGGRQECGSPSGDESADERWAAQHDYFFGGRGESRTRLDLITGGFPCQPFSQAGKQGGANDDRYLWPELARLVAALRPRWCLFENVSGIVNMAGGLERVWADLEAVGYEVGAVVIPAAAVGAPHKRDRVWIIARDMADTRREGCPAGGIRGGAAAQGEVLDLGLADGGNSRRGADVSESDALRRGRWQDHEGQASSQRDGYPQTSDVADTESHRVGDAQLLAHAIPGGGQAREVPSSGSDARGSADVADAAARGIRRGSAPGQPGQPALGGEDAADANGAGRGEHGWPLDVPAQLAAAQRGGRERHAGAEVERELGQQTHGLPGRMDGRLARRPFGPDWEDGIARVTTHEVDRVSKLKALGNSIVPQVAYELLLMLLTVDDEYQALEA